MTMTATVSIPTPNRERSTTEFDPISRFIVTIPKPSNRFAALLPIRNQQILLQIPLHVPIAKEHVGSSLMDVARCSSTPIWHTRLPFGRCHEKVSELAVRISDRNHFCGLFHPGGFYEMHCVY